MVKLASVLLVGCGKMGGAMARGWVERGLDRLVIVEPSGQGLEDVAGRAGVELLSRVEDVRPDFRPAVVVLAVKPQSMDEALPSYSRFRDSLILSIAAGKTVAYLQSHFGSDAAIVRAMPNLPASIGRGMTAAVASPAVDAAQRDQAQALLEACGAFAWVGDEGLMDAVTAVSGSGPAYLFLMIEALAAAGAAAGLPPELAMGLARTTMSGAGELVHVSDQPADQLRRNVTSPGGTTEAALRVLMAPDGLAPLMTRAIAAATARGRALAG